MPAPPRLILALIHSVLIQGTFVAARHQPRHIGGLQQRGGWGVQNHAKITPSAQKKVLESYLGQARGGSDYPEEKDYGDYKYRDYRDDYADDRRGSDNYEEYDDRGRSSSASVSCPENVFLDSV
jgi:hypothetical protein